MNNLNILLIGNSGCGKTSLYMLLLEYYQLKDIPINNVLHINNLKEQGNIIEMKLKRLPNTFNHIWKKKFIILDDIDIINDQSQQVFRNCIDKYSHNVHFLSSCSNIKSY